MNAEQITHMVNRFLQWKLPKDFQPDCGIHFDANAAKKLNPNNHTYEPVGTNLLTADQAKEMVCFMIDGLRSSGTAPKHDDYVAWLRWSGDEAHRHLVVCDSDSEGAFKVYRTNLFADASDAGKDGMPLKAEVEANRLCLGIGISTLAWALEHGEGNNPFNEASGDYEQRYRISDPLQFAKDVCHEMNREGEDGSTPLTRFLDSMMDEAVEQGSLGILDPDDSAEPRSR